ncbi:hypothetical protein BC940DRAFT_310856 [Gongronella butleri]|nr:hypothetical protein BC940DRAFT_310856 [Gongronella butleri]
MNFSTAKKFSQGRFVHTSHSSLRKCCGCIHLRVGSVLATFVWAGFSLYFAIISFQVKSPFFSYTQTAPAIVFGVVNLFLFIVSLLGVFCIFINSAQAVNYYIRMLWIMLFFVLGDAFINMILFGTYQGDYQTWCVNESQQALPNGTALATSGLDYYNCSKLWQDEFKFTLICVSMMVILSLYWATCIYSYSHKLQAMELWALGMMQGHVEGIVPYYHPPVMPAEPDVIVLQNKKPSRYESKSGKPESSSSFMDSLKKLTSFKHGGTPANNAVGDSMQTQQHQLPPHTTLPSSTSPIGFLPSPAPSSSYTPRHVSAGFTPPPSDRASVIEIN